MPRYAKELPDLTDNDLMPGTGKHAGEKLEDVPNKYLLFIYENNMCSSRVKKYIENNLETIKQLAKKEE